MLSEAWFAVRRFKLQLNYGTLWNVVVGRERARDRKMSECGWMIKKNKKKKVRDKMISVLDGKTGI